MMGATVQIATKMLVNLLLRLHTRTVEAWRTLLKTRTAQQRDNLSAAKVKFITAQQRQEGSIYNG